VGGERRGCRTRVGESALKFVGEEEVGEFRSAVGGPWPVALRELKIVEVESAAPVGGAGHGHDPGSGHGSQPIEQEAGEGEVAEVVRGQCQFETVEGAAIWSPHHAGVVDQDVEVVGARLERRRRCPNGGLRGEVEPEDAQPGVGSRRSDSVGCVVCLLVGATGENDSCSELGERFRCFESNSGVRACDYGDLSGALGQAGGSPGHG
jgi:hypothetical protein